MDNIYYPGYSVPSGPLSLTLPVLSSQTLLQAGGASNQLWQSPAEGQTYQDCVRLLDKLKLMATSPSIETLARLIPGGRKSGNVYTNGYISYVIEGHYQWIEEPTFFADQSYALSQPRQRYCCAGEWTVHCSGGTGHGIIPLIEKLSGCDVRAAYAWIAQECGASLEARDVPQMGLGPQDNFIATPYLYELPPTLSHPTLGQPQHWCWFKTEFGQDSFWFGVWVIDSQPVGLFCSLVFDAKSQRPEWKFVLPPAAAMIFNKHRIRQEPTLPIFICDELELVAKFQDNHEYVTTWSGGKEHVMEMDWQLFAGRDVTFLMSKEHRDAYVTGDKLRAIFNRMGTNLKIERADA